MKNISFGSHLFARPSLIEGISRLLDIGGTLQRYHETRTENEADLEALKHDWQVVGDDLRYAVKTYGQRLAKTT